MIYILCSTCNSGLRVSPGKDDEAEELIGPASDWYPNKYPCPTCDAMCSLVPSASAEELSQFDMRDVTPMEAFVALSGAGFPEEQDCGTTAVEQLFSTKRVKGVATRLIHNSKRCIIDHVEFEDGSKAYFGASAYGATIFRISKPSSYAARVGHG